MSRAQIFNNEQKLELAELMKGMSTRQLANHYGKSYMAMYQYINNHKEELQTNNRLKKEHDERLSKLLSYGYEIATREQIKESLMGGST